MHPLENTNTSLPLYSIIMSHTSQARVCPSDAGYAPRGPCQQLPRKTDHFRMHDHVNENQRLAPVESAYVPVMQEVQMEDPANRYQVRTRIMAQLRAGSVNQGPPRARVQRRRFVRTETPPQSVQYTTCRRHLWNSE
jgi:hypothetical protein